MHDYVCLTETFMDRAIDDDTFKDFKIYQAKAHKLSKHGRCSGGVVVLVRNCLLPFVERVKYDGNNVVIVKLSKELLGLEKDVFVIALYIPPHDSPFWTDSDSYGVEVLEKCMLDLQESYEDFNVIITGDLNSRTANKNFDFSLSDDIHCFEDIGNSLDRESHDTETNQFGETLLDFCNIFDCYILNGLVHYGFDESCTFISNAGSSLVDYFMASFDLFSKLSWKSLSMSDMLLSDHLPVTLIIALKTDLSKDTLNTNNQKTTFVNKLMWDKTKETEVMANFNDIDISNRLEAALQEVEHDVDQALNTFNDCMKNAADCMVKTCAFPGKKRCIWFDQECKDMKREGKRLLRLFWKKRLESDRLEYVRIKRDYRKLLKQKKQDFRRNTAESLAANANKSGEFWKELNKLSGGNTKKSVSDNISLENWFKHFQGVFSQDDTSDENGSHIYHDISDAKDHCLNTNITENEVRDSIRKLNNGKAGGIDGIVPEMLKVGGERIVRFLTVLFNRVFDTGIYPREWSKAIVIPIFKKGDTDKPDNYRGVSLINATCKCYTSILNKRLSSWLEDSDIIVENQAGFRKNYSTVDQIFNLYAIVQKYLNRKGQKLYVAFVDFRKAFDSVNHEKLLEALSNEGVNGRFFVAIKSMYESLLSCVRVNNNFSDFFECPVGVRQGCVMSPTLFSLFINQLANHINSKGVHGVQLLPTLMELFILLFADDVALISTSPGGLQAQLNSLKVCCDELKLKVNIDKTKVMIFRKGGFVGQREKWFFEGNALEVVNKYCYLGFSFTTMLSLRLGTNHLVAKGKRALSWLCRAFKKCKEMSPDIYFKIFEAKVQSVLLYSSEIWGYKRLDGIEKVHLLACKRYLGVPLKTPNKMAYGELGRYPLYVNSQIRCIKYWFRLLEMDQTRLPKQAYLMMLSLDREGKRCWATEIRELLSNAGFYEIWLNQGVGHVKIFLKTLKQRLVDVFFQEWYGTIRDKERYCLYRQIKDNLNVCAYLEDIDIFCFRVALTQIRCGVLAINSNMNRYGHDITESYCPLCKQSIENEEHFIYFCPLYVELRTRFFAKGMYPRLGELLEGESKQLSRSVSKFVFHAMKTRQKFIETDRLANNVNV